eukprot:gene50545-50854_t
MTAAHERLLDAHCAGDEAGMIAALPDAELALSLLPDPQCDDDAETVINTGIGMIN